MAHLESKRIKIYQSRFHVFITLFIVIFPFLFLLLFSRFIHVATGTLFRDLFVSVERMVIAYVIAGVLGWLLAVLFYRREKSAIALPVFDVLQNFPTFTVLPLAVSLWGNSNFVVIFILIIILIWPIFFSILSPLKLIKRDWVEVVGITGLSGFNYLRLFLLPITIPGFITGSIIGLGEGWEALIATEMIVGIKPSLGSFFQMFSHNIPVTAFGILGFLILIFSLNKILWLPLLEWSHKRMEE